MAVHVRVPKGDAVIGAPPFGEGLQLWPKQFVQRAPSRVFSRDDQFVSLQTPIILLGASLPLSAASRQPRNGLV